MKQSRVALARVRATAWAVAVLASAACATAGAGSFLDAGDAGATRDAREDASSGSDAAASREGGSVALPDALSVEDTAPPADGPSGDSEPADAGGTDGARSCVAGASCNPSSCTVGTLSCTAGTSVCSMSGNVAMGTSCGASSVCNGSGTCVACAEGATCGTPPNQCEVALTSCSTGGPVCVTAPAAAGTACDDSNPCTTSDQCNGAGTCSGTPIPVSYTDEGSSATTVYPLGTADGACVISAFYCSTEGPTSVAPPAGYTNAPSSPDGCDYNGVAGGAVAPNYQENFCKSCGGDCAMNCP